MLKHMSTLPQVIKAIMMAFLTILAIRVTYPIANYILAKFPIGNMRTAAILAYWIVVIFSTWFLTYATIFKKKEAIKQ